MSLCVCVCLNAWSTFAKNAQKGTRPTSGKRRKSHKQTNKQKKKALCYFWKFCDTDEGIVDKTTQPLLPSFLRCQLKRKEKEEEKKKADRRMVLEKRGTEWKKKKKKQTSAKNEEICCITLLLSVVAALFLKARKAHRERDMLFLGRFCSTERAPSERNRKWFHRLSFSWVEEHFVCVYVCV